MKRLLTILLVICSVSVFGQLQPAPSGTLTPLSTNQAYVRLSDSTYYFYNGTNYLWNYFLNKQQADKLYQPLGSPVATPFSLSTGYGLSGSSFNGSVARTFTADTASADGLVSKSRLATNLGGYVPSSRTITINGSTRDLTANRIFNVGTVLSVGATAGTGISISGSPITSSGSFVITNTAPSPASLPDSLLNKANKDFSNVASGAIAKSKVDTTATGLQTVSNFFPKGDTRYLRSSVASSTYLPLSGGTLTGPLNGTSAAFSGNGSFGTSSGNLEVGYSTFQNIYKLDVNGKSRFTDDMLLNGMTLGLGTGSIASNLAFGANALFNNTTGANNVAIGTQTLEANTTGGNNTALGRQSLLSNTTGGFNTAIGVNALRQNTSGTYNIAQGYQALYFNSLGSWNIGIGANTFYSGQGNTHRRNIAIGFEAGRYASDGVTAITSAQNSILIGDQSKLAGSAQTNQIVIGASAVGLGSNTTVIGTPSTVTSAIYGNLLLGTTTDSGYKLDVNGTGRFTSALTANSFVKTGGISTEFLKGDGSVTTLSATSPIFYNSTTGVISSQAASATLEGYVTTGTQIFSDGKSFTNKVRVKTDNYGYSLFMPADVPAIILRRDDGLTTTMQSWDNVGNSTITGNLTATSIIKSGGTSSQFLMADGSVNTSVLASGAYLPLAGGTLAGGLSGTSATFSGGLKWGASTFESGIAKLYTDASYGVNLVSKTGSIADFLLLTPSGGQVLSVPTGTTTVALNGALTGTSATFSGNVSASNLTSGTYTPTLTNTSGIASSTAGTGAYQRIGNQVSGFVDFSATGTSEGVSGVFGVSLPIASNFSSATNVWGGYGVARSGETIAPLEEVSADTTNDRFIVKATLTDLSVRTIRINFNYTVQ